MEMSELQITKVKECNQSASSLTIDIDNCIKPSKSSAESCNCFAALNKTNLEKVIGCSIEEESNIIAKNAKKKCGKGNILI